MNGLANDDVSPEAWIKATRSLVDGRGLSSITLCDTAFGNGLRFLTLWEFWLRNCAPGAKLHVVAFASQWSWPGIKKERARAVSSGLRALDAALESKWPDATPGVHRLNFNDDAVTLTLIFRPLSVALRQTDAIVDVFWIPDTRAFFSEACGVSPAGQLVRMANANAQVVSLAGLGKERLSQALQQSGFLVQRPGKESRGFVQARLRAGLCYTRRSCLAQADVMVVGAGVAGAAIAWSLAQRGHHVQVFDPMLRVSHAGVHDGHRAAALSPYLSKDDDFRARLSRAGLARAWANWSGLEEGARPVRCGTLGLPTEDRPVELWQAMLDRLGLPDSWATWLAPSAASQKSNEALEHGGCYFSSGMLIRPHRLVPALLSHHRISMVSEAVAYVRKFDTGRVGLKTEGGSTHQASIVVLANARHIGSLLCQLTKLSELPMIERMQAVPGQVSYFDAASLSGGPTCILDASAYWLPQVDGLLTAGGTYDLSQSIAHVSNRGHKDIARKLSRFLPARQPMLSRSNSAVGGWAGWRAVVAGRLPVMGPLPGQHQVWLATAYGSRGLTWAALAADLIGASLNNEPGIMERDLSAAVLPR
ncbi:MAG: FAD-dependent 5-carboxymethylaminomethyl-2-thiouridine(34) oxidoreductase MnmC [Pusillimonas sp.]|nr:FAD-dependent 5-carboxymethylaminomethyl-2-thiouridine(34) oxidoreductase MnmC [Pusillimonas sp.]